MDHMVRTVMASARPPLQGPKRLLSHPPGTLSSVPNGGEGRGGELLRAHHLQMGSKPSLHDIIRMATLTPAERTGLSADRGSLTPGKRADILILSPTLRVKQVFSGGMRLPA